MPHSKWCFFAAVFGNVTNRETAERLGGLVDLVITAVTPYEPHVSSAAPFTNYAPSSPIYYALHAPAHAEVARPFTRARLRP